MFLFTTLDYVDTNRKVQSLVIEQPLKTVACARHFVECCYDLLTCLTDQISSESLEQIEGLLHKVEIQVAEHGLKVFVDRYDDDITCHVSMMQKLDQLGESPEVLRVTQMCLKHLKTNFKTFAD